MKPVKSGVISPEKEVLTRLQRSIKERLTGESALNERDLELAENSFKKAIELNPNCTECQLHLAWTFFHQGKHREAITIIEFLLDKDRYPTGTLHLKALLLCIAERYTEAEEAYLQALRDDHTLKDAELENAIWGLI
ncbi:MAG: tetratricopeptide repeat protein [Bacteroidota bacterium]